MDIILTAGRARLSADATVRAYLVNGEPGFNIDDDAGIRLVGLVHGAYVLVQNHGAWQVVLAQTTPIAES